MLGLWWQALPRERGAGGMQTGSNKSGSATAQGWESRGVAANVKWEKEAVMEGAQRRGVYVH